MRVCLIVLAVLSTGPVAAAEAATVDLRYTGYRGGDPRAGDGRETYVIRIVDDVGEPNQISVARTTGGLVVSDARAALVAGPNCTPVDPQTVACVPIGSGEPSISLEIHAGAGDDDVQVPFFADVDAGPGDDRVSTASGTLLGGPGDDDLTVGLAGTIDGGLGADTMRGDPSSTTRSSVMISYATRSGPVSITDNGVADDGEPGEGDLVGPGTGRDHVDADPFDAVRSVDGERDAIGCSDGTRSVLALDAIDLVESCAPRLTLRPVVTRTRMAAGGVPVRVSCPPTGVDCRGWLTLGRGAFGKRHLPGRRLSLRSGRHATIVLPVPAQERRMAARGRTLSMVVIATTARAQPGSTWSTQLNLGVDRGRWRGYWY